MTRRLRIGFLMNPVAGLGGPAGLKGSDDAAALGPIVAATTLEQTPSYRRAVETFSFLPLKNAVVVAAPGILGAEALKPTMGRGGPFFEVLRLGVPAKPFGQTTAEDTKRFAAALAAADLDLLVFAGGDGTATDVANAVDGAVPILGIPTGVKMFSGVFALSAAQARDILSRLTPGFPTRSVDVVDLDEASYRHGGFHVLATAIARTPEDEAVQFGKGGGTVPEAEALGDLVQWFRETQRPDVLYIVGAGSTTYAVKEALGGGTPLGVDAYLGGRCVAADADAPTLASLVEAHPDARIVVSPTGTQGAVLGRGTAQISPDVVSAVGVDHVVVVATPSKLNGTFALFVDTGDAQLDASFPEYVRVRTDPSTEKMMRVRRPPRPAPRQAPGFHGFS